MWTMKYFSVVNPLGNHLNNEWHVTSPFSEMTRNCSNSILQPHRSESDATQYWRLFSLVWLEILIRMLLSFLVHFGLICSSFFRSSEPLFMDARILSPWWGGIVAVQNVNKLH